MQVELEFLQGKLLAIGVGRAAEEVGGERNLGVQAVQATLPSGARLRDGSWPFLGKGWCGLAGGSAQPCQLVARGFKLERCLELGETCLEGGDALLVDAAHLGNLAA